MTADFYSDDRFPVIPALLASIRTPTQYPKQILITVAIYALSIAIALAVGGLAFLAVDNISEVLSRLRGATGIGAFILIFALLIGSWVWCFNYWVRIAAIREDTEETRIKGAARGILGNAGTFILMAILMLIISFPLLFIMGVIGLQALVQTTLDGMLSNSPIYILGWMVVSVVLTWIYCLVFAQFSFGLAKRAVDRKVLRRAKIGGVGNFALVLLALYLGVTIVESGSALLFGADSYITVAIQIILTFFLIASVGAAHGHAYLWRTTVREENEPRSMPEMPVT